MGVSILECQLVIEHFQYNNVEHVHSKVGHSRFNLLKFPRWSSFIISIAMFIWGLRFECEKCSAAYCKKIVVICVCQNVLDWLRSSRWFVLFHWCHGLNNYNIWFELNCEIYHSKQNCKNQIMSRNINKTMMGGNWSQSPCTSFSEIKIIKILMRTITFTSNAV